MSWLEDFFQQNLGKQITGYFGALGALCALIIGVLNLKDRIQPPAVLIVTTEAPLRLQSTLIRGADPTDPIFTQKKLGTVLMEITNESPPNWRKRPFSYVTWKIFGEW